MEQYEEENQQYTQDAQQKQKRKKACCGQKDECDEQERDYGQEWFAAAAMNDGNTITLMLAIRHNCLNVVKQLKNVELQCLLQSNSTCIQGYIGNYQLTRINLPKYSSPLHIAVYYQNYMALQMLVDQLQVFTNNEDITAPLVDSHGLSFIELATAYNWVFLLPFIKQNANYIFQNQLLPQSKNQFNLLYIAIHFGNVQITKLLIQLYYNDQTKQYVHQLFDQFQKQKWNTPLTEIVNNVQIHSKYVNQCAEMYNKFNLDCCYKQSKWLQLFINKQPIQQFSKKLILLKERFDEVTNMQQRLQQFSETFDDYQELIEQYPAFIQKQQKVQKVVIAKKKMMVKQQAVVDIIADDNKLDDYQQCQLRESELLKSKIEDYFQSQLSKNHDSDEEDINNLLVRCSNPMKKQNIRKKTETHGSKAIPMERYDDYSLK